MPEPVDRDVLAEFGRAAGTKHPHVPDNTPALKPGEGVAMRADGTIVKVMRFEPGFNADGSLREVSIVGETQQRASPYRPAGMSDPAVMGPDGRWQFGDPAEARRARADRPESTEPGEDGRRVGAFDDLLDRTRTADGAQLDTLWGAYRRASGDRRITGDQWTALCEAWRTRLGQLEAPSCDDPHHDPPAGDAFACLTDLIRTSDGAGLPHLGQRVAAFRSAGGLTPEQAEQLHETWTARLRQLVAPGHASCGEVHPTLDIGCAQPHYRSETSRREGRDV